MVFGYDSSGFMSLRVQKKKGTLQFFRWESKSPIFTFDISSR